MQNGEIAQPLAGTDGAVLCMFYAIVCDFMIQAVRFLRSHYDGLLYLFSLMHLSGSYRIITPQAKQEDANTSFKIAKVFKAG